VSVEDDAVAHRWEGSAVAEPAISLNDCGEESALSAAEADGEKATLIIQSALTYSVAHEWFPGNQWIAVAGPSSRPAAGPSRRAEPRRKANSQVSTAMPPARGEGRGEQYASSPKVPRSSSVASQIGAASRSRPRLAGPAHGGGEGWQVRNADA
jgi:hypothetical protein